MSGEIKAGYQPSDLLDEYNALQYIVRGEIENMVNTAELVKVLKNNQDGTIDVIPIIRNIDNTNTPIEEAPVFSVHYIRLQAGLNSVKLEPEQGDIGLLIVSKKDTSGIENGFVKTKRKYNLCDGIYIGGICGLNQTPTQYIDFTSTGMTIKSTQAINVEAPTVNVNATTQIKLGTNATKQIARVGDNVVSGTTVIGQIQANDSIVRSL